MNRNNFLPHIALALVLILVAAFAGQLRKWQKQWRTSVRLVPAASKTREVWAQDGIARDDTGVSSEPELLVKFRPGVSKEKIREITARLHDQVEDEIEAVNGLETIDDLDNADRELVASEYRSLGEVEYAEVNQVIALEPSEEIK